MLKEDAVRKVEEVILKMDVLVKAPNSDLLETTECRLPKKPKFIGYTSWGNCEES